MGLSLAPVAEVAPARLAEIRMSGLRDTWGNCRRCDLCETRKGMVFGHGNPSAPIMIVTSNTNGYEAFDKKPLAGPAGQVVLQCAVAEGLLPREDFYVTSAVKCLPPKETTESGEIRRKVATNSQRETCAVSLRAQLDIVKPAILIIHGRTANETLLGDPRPLNKYAGHIRQFGPSCIAVSTHNHSRVSMDETGQLQAEYRRLWRQIAVRLDCLGRMWRPDALVFQRGWSLLEGVDV